MRTGDAAELIYRVHDIRLYGRTQNGRIALHALNESTFLLNGDFSLDQFRSAYIATNSGARENGVPSADGTDGCLRHSKLIGGVLDRLKSDPAMNRKHIVNSSTIPRYGDVN